MTVGRGGRRGRGRSVPSSCERGERVLGERGGDGGDRGGYGGAFGEGFLALSIVFELRGRERAKEEGEGREDERG